MNDLDAIRALTDPTASTAELLGPLGADAIATPKPSRPAEVWVLELKPDGDGPPMAHRVRAVLKRLLRSYGVRCVSVRGPEANNG